jgi:hypothetical protein
VSKRKGEDRLGRAFLKGNEEKREDLVFGNWLGEGQESVPNLADGTLCLKAGQGIRTGRRILQDDVGLCTVKTVEAISCAQQNICGWLR